MINIRNMDMSDVPFVYNTEKSIFGNSLQESMLYDELIYNTMSQYFIALNNGKRLGYVGVWITEPNAEIVNIVVLETHRNQGVAKQLMRKALDYCKENKVEMVTLEVRKSNQSAVHLYKQFGFQTEAERKQYYNDGEDAHLMVLKLGGIT